jgi:hypothetical protein
VLVFDIVLFKEFSFLLAISVLSRISLIIFFFKTAEYEFLILKASPIDWILVGVFIV